MESTNKIDIDLEGIAYVLSDNRLSVPVYQRPYSWEETHVRDLFRDLAEAMRDNQIEYFLGSIVIAENSQQQRPEVVDGQQRLATVTILLAAIRDYFFLREDNRYEDIGSHYLRTRDLLTQEWIPHFYLSRDDHDFFMKRIISLPNSPERNEATLARESHKRIDKAAELAKDHVRNIVDMTNQPSEALISWVYYLRDSARIIKVMVPSHANAFVIFETLNDRGLDLAVTDLLKNFLFLTAGDRLQEAQNYWIAMMGVLESVEDQEITADYVRHLWSSKYGAVRQKELYDHIKDKVTSKQGAIDFASELSRNARFYLAILNTNHELWRNYPSGVKDSVETINLLRMVQIRPLLLAVLEKFSPQELENSFRVMVCWGVRFLISGGLGGGTLERHYSECARKVRVGEVTSTSELISAMQGVVPSDAQFYAAFAAANVAKNYLARYYLRALEKEERGEREPELVPNPNQAQVNLEHVLPQNPSEEWSYLDEDTRQSYCKRIGNLALVSAELNTSADNQGFLAKREEYRYSNYLLTSQIAEYENWGPKEIEDRQRKLAHLAVEAWKVKA